MKPNAPAKNPTLNRRQQIFIAEYLIDLDATRAAIRAGYSKKSAYQIGAENLRKPYIKDAIDAVIEERKKKISVTAESVINELALIGFGNMSGFFKINKEGVVQAIPLDELAEGKSRIIRRIKEKRTTRQIQGEEKTEIVDAIYEFELCDKVKALELLCRHLGLLNDKVTMVDSRMLKEILAAMPPEIAEGVRQRLIKRIK